MATRTVKQLARDLERAGASHVLLGTFLLVIFYYQLDAGNLRPLLARHLGPTTNGAAWLALGVRFLGGLFLLVGVPALWARWRDGATLRDLGWRIGDWRFGLKAALLLVVLFTPFLYANAGLAAVRARYPLLRVSHWSPARFVAWEATYLVYYLAWEGFFRGFWLLELRRRSGFPAAMLLQTAVSTVFHVGVPETETMSALAAGLLFGFVAIRSESVLPVVLVHWYVGAATDLFCLLRG